MMTAGFLDRAVLDGLAKGVELDSQFIGHSAPGPAAEEEFPRATDDVGGHHRRSAFRAALIKRPNTPLAVLLDPTLHGVLRDAEGLEDLGLTTRSLIDQLRRKPLERRAVVLGVTEDGKNPTRVGPGPAHFEDADPIIDLRGPIWDKWEQCLWHGTFLSRMFVEIQEEGTISFSAAQAHIHPPSNAPYLRSRQQMRDLEHNN
jgi:hypothetical protein